MTTIDTTNRLTGALPLQPQTRQQLDQAEVDRRSQTPGFFQAIGDTVNVSWMESGQVRALARGGFEFDPDFNPYTNTDTFDRLTTGLPPDMWAAFDSSVSMPHAMRIREQKLNEVESRRRLSTLGWGGVGLQVAASILDPEAIAMTSLTAGFAGPAVWGGKVSRLGRIVRTAGLAGAENAAITGVMAAADPTIGTDDVLYAGAAGLIMGTGFSAIGGLLSKAGHGLRRDVEARDALMAMGAASADEIYQSPSHAFGLVSAAELEAQANRARSIRAKVDEVLTEDARRNLEAAAGPEAQRAFADSLVSKLALDDPDLEAELRSFHPSELFTRLKSPTFDPNAPIGINEERAAELAGAAGSPIPPGPVAGDIMDPLPKSELLGRLEEGGLPRFVLKPIEAMGHAGKTQRESVGDTLLKVATGEIAQETPGDARLLALAESLNRAGELKGFNLEEIPAAGLKVGQEWRLDRRWRLQVAEAGPDTVKVHVQNMEGIPVGGGDMLPQEPFTVEVPRGAMLPANEGSFRVRGAFKAQPVPEEQARQVEQKLAALSADPAKVDQLYAQVPESHGGKVIGTDIARFLAPEYRTRGGRLAFTRATSKPASKLADELFYRRLQDTPPREDGQPSLLVAMAGGVASGKSHAIGDAVIKRADLVLDTQMRDLAGSIKKIDAAIEAGWDVQIEYVQRPFDLVVRGAIQRAQEEGRWGSVRELPDIHMEVQRTIHAIGEHYKGNPQVQINYRSNPGTRETPIPVSRLEAADVAPGGRLRYEDKAILEGVVNDELKAARESGKISSAVLDRLEGKTPEQRPAAGGNQEGNRRGAQQAGAGNAAPEGLTKKPGDLDLSRVSDAESKYGAVRFSMVGRLGQSDDRLVVRAARSLAEDALPARDGSPVNESGSEWARRTYKTFGARFYREAQPALKAWMKDQGIPVVRTFQARKQFFEEVARTVRLAPGTITDPNIRRTADLMRNLHRELLGIAQRHGVPGFDKIPENPSYLMRLWSNSKLDNATEAYGDATIHRLFASAIKAATPDIEDAHAEKLAKGFIKAIRNLDKYTDVERAGHFGGDNIALLEEMLKDAGLQADDIRNITTALTPSKDGPRDVHAKRRFMVDENHRISLPDGSTLGIGDLLENDAELLFSAYSRHIAGSSAMAEFYRSMGAAIARETGEEAPKFTRWQQFQDFMGRRGVDQAELSKLDTLRKSVSGLPLGRNTAGARALQTIRSFNYINVGGQFGIAQVPELASLVGEAGVKVMIQQMPALAGIFSRAKSGKLNSQLLEEMEVIFGLGTDRLTHQITGRFDDSVAEFGGGALQRALKRGAKWSNDLSFMAPINIFLQRASGAAAAQKITNLLYSGNKIRPQRLASLGLTPEDWTKLLAQRGNIITEPGMFGRNVKRLNLDGWTDQDAAAKLVTAIQKWSSRVIQENDVGQMSAWMTTDLGRALVQFRTFTISAWEKQMLHRVAMRDWEAFSGAMATSFLAGLTYAGQQYVASLGRPDAQEFRDQRLTTGAIARMAFSRGGYSSLFPQMLDTADLFTGGSGDWFSAGRSTGLSSDAIFGNPSTALVTNIGKAAAGVGKTVRGSVGLGEPHQFNQKDAAAISRLWPFQRVMGIRNVLDAIGGELPEE